MKEGDFVALSGKSGSGKTTLLRILAGLEDAEGKIEVGNELWLDGKKALAPQKRKIGYVFQEYALFPNMTVEENLLFVNKDKVLAEHLLEMTELDALKNRLPNSLSGGQQQRVSLCRAMMNRPKLLLMDEPLSALDPSMRTKLQNEILTLHKEFGTTTIMVSHDPSEIYRLASRVLVLDLGKIINDGNPKNILLKTQGSQKFSFEGELLDITKVDVIYIAIVSIGQQLVEVVVSSDEAKNLKIGQKVTVSTKAFAPMIV
jgi:molybdate transport system ATP-binding protein